MEFIGIVEGESGQALVVVKEGLKLKLLTYEEWERLL